MQIQKNISLKPFNTFGINARAGEFACFSTVGELEELVAGTHGKRPLILGGGSNILLTKDVEGLVLKNEIKGITELH